VASKWGRSNMVQLLLDSHALVDCRTRVKLLLFNVVGVYFYIRASINVLTAAVANDTRNEKGGTREPRATMTREQIVWIGGSRSCRFCFTCMV